MIKMSEKIIPSFYSLWKAIKNPDFLHVVAKGGRGSSKSTTISIAIVMRRMQTKTHAVCVRKTGRTLRASCRNQIIWAIYHLGVQDYWEWSDTPTGDPTMTYKPTGTKIFFEGADGDKIKGWKTTPIPTTDIWFEELAEFKDDYNVTSIVLSILRTILPDGYHYKFMYSYNPPKRRSSWVNKKYESKLLPDNIFVHHSDYRTNPFLPKEFNDEAEHIKTTNNNRYRWEYLGEPIGSGMIPFDNLVFRKITKEELDSFDNFRQGNDWGYASDPNAFVRWHYDKTRRRIFACAQIYGVKMSNRELAKAIRHNGFERIRTTADSAEPKSVDELKSEGCNFASAKKGPGSVEYGEKWLNDLEEIVIDPELTPDMAREFDGAEYDIDRDGNPTTRIVDKDNHTIDATRYAFERDMGKKGISILR